MKWTVILIAVSALRCQGADVAVQSNVVYGMYSGAALLMDVYVIPVKVLSAGN